uniref:Uncharacterized protein n=1 Tax=Clytia hemisphaerica TaxID=252671 RepID=A0A7M5VDM2_9CNID|eukprot:TCONS_00002567-protein
MRSRTVWFICTIICHTIALGLFITAILGDSWAVITMKNGAHILNNEKVVTLNGEAIGHYGLWTYCTNNTSICRRQDTFYGDKNGDWFKACQISATTACIFALTAFLASLVNPCCPDCAGVIATLNMFLGWICITAAVAIFTAQETTNLEYGLMEKRSWGWTYIVAWCSSATSLVSSVIAWLSYSPKNQDHEVDALFG